MRNEDQPARVVDRGRTRHRFDGHLVQRCQNVQHRLAFPVVLSEQFSRETNTGDHILGRDVARGHVDGFRTHHERHEALRRAEQLEQHLAELKCRLDFYDAPRAD